MSDRANMYDVKTDGPRAALTAGARDRSSTEEPDMQNGSTIYGDTLAERDAAIAAYFRLSGIVKRALASDVAIHPEWRERFEWASSTSREWHPTVDVEQALERFTDRELARRAKAVAA